MIASSSWFVRRHRPEAGARLFCFPFSGGGPSAFRGWADALPELEVCALQAPGRETRLREAPFVRMEPLVAAAVAAMTPLLDVPFAFFGHSLGAFVALEIARALHRSDLPLPVRLFAVACPPPGLHTAESPVHGEPDERLLERVRRYGGTADVVLQSDELMRVLLPVIRADFTVYETYAPVVASPLPLPITAMSGLSDETVPRAWLAGWGAHTALPLSVRMFPGNHFFPQTARSDVLRAVREDFGPHYQVRL